MRTKSLTIFILILSLWFPFSKATAGGLESSCRNKYAQESCLTTFMLYKCMYYMGTTGALSRYVSCNEAVVSLISKLDLGASPIQSNSKIQEEVAFKGQLLKKIGMVSTTKLLKNIKQRLEDSLEQSNNFYLWDEMIHLSGNAEKALENIAVLFQDTTESPAHISYLKALNLSNTATQNTELLAELLSYFSLQALNQISLIKVYPQDFENVLNKTFYHFYIITYLSKQLSKLGMSNEMSFFVPFLFNTQYEFKGLKGWPLNDPQGNQLTDWKIKEIYSGYLAGLAGIKRIDTAIKYSEFKKQLQENSQLFIKQLFFTRFKPGKILSY